MALGRGWRTARRRWPIRFTLFDQRSGIYGIDRETGKEGEVPRYPSPEELWAKGPSRETSEWRDRVSPPCRLGTKGGSHPSRCHQDIAVERAEWQPSQTSRPRILLSLRHERYWGVTFIAFQIRVGVCSAQLARVLRCQRVQLGLTATPEARTTSTPTGTSASRSISTRSRRASTTAS